MAGEFRAHAPLLRPGGERPDEVIEQMKNLSPSTGELVRRQPGVCAFLAVLSLLGSLFSLAQPAVMGGLIDSLGTGRSVTAALFCLITIFVAGAAVTGLKVYLSVRFSENGTIDVRRALLARIVRAPVPSLAGQSAAELSARAVNDPPLLTQGAVALMSGSIASIITCAGAAIACLRLFPGAFLAASACAVLAIVLTGVLGTRIKNRRFLVQDATGELSGDVQTIIDGIASIRHYDVTAKFEERLDADLRNIRFRALDLARFHSLVGPLTTLVLGAALVVAMLISAVEVARGRASLAHLISFIMYFQMTTSGFQDVLSTYVSFQEARAGRDRLQEIDQRLGEPDAERTADVELEAGPISFSGVRFDYDGRTVLNDVSFSIPQGATTAIVGASGAGKTTILNLMEGFLRPDAGVVGGLIASRRSAGFVDQAATVIKGSIADNVRFERSGVSDEQVCAVLERVGLVEYATADGIRARVQARGQSLSGGERQRLVLARALVTGADTLILDEPTSNVDGVLEQQMLDAVEELAPDATVVVVAHRPATVKRADYLIYLDKGKIKEEGSPLECLSRNRGLREVLGDWGMNR